MEPVFLYGDFRKFIKAAIKARANNGFGELTKLAAAIGVNNTFVSQVLNGTKLFSPEQALATATYLNLSELERDYFVTLVQLDRAGTSELRDYLREKLAKLKAQSEALVNRVAHQARLTDEQRAVFYSDWLYSAVRLSTLIPGRESVEKLAAHFHLPEGKVREVVDVLLASGLIVHDKRGLRIGPLSTHLEATSPLVKSHHANWRQKALAAMSNGDAQALHYSAPMTLSRADAERVREILIDAINRIDKIVEPSPSEELMCVNFDWFRVT